MQRLNFLETKVGEAGISAAEAEGWGGVAVPKATPSAIVERILDRGTVPDPRGAGEWSAFVEAEVAKWGDIARRAKMKQE